VILNESENAIWNESEILSEDERVAVKLEEKLVENWSENENENEDESEMIHQVQVVLVSTISNVIYHVSMNDLWRLFHR
jgi:hypothetical protein